MPLRRSSAQTFNNSPSTRFRPTLDHDATSSLQDGAGWSREGLMGEQKVISALVNRLVNKLPCNSGIRLGMMEVDDGVRTTVESLTHMARIRLPLVVHALSGALEALSKYSSSVSLIEAPLDTIQSQLYLLHLLLTCLSSSWRQHALANPAPPSDLPRAWPDPPALDDNLARYLLSVILVYIRMTSQDNAAVSGGTTSPAPSSKERGGLGSGSSLQWGRQLAPSSGSYSLGIRFIQLHSFFSHAPPAQRSKLLAASSSTPSSAITQMSKYASRIVFILSASNWPLIISRLKTRVAYLSTTIEEMPDLIELRLLEWANLDRNRLGQVMQEISSPFLHVKRPAQVAIAVTLRKAIWNWIDVYPAEYGALVESNRKLEGGPDVLFDVLHSMAEPTTANARRVKVFYPLMAMLLVLSPDSLKRLAIGDTGKGSSGLAKKAAFMDSLRKGLSGNKVFEACAVCYVDFVRAATCLSPRIESAGLHALVPDIQNDLKNALFFSSLSSEISDPNILVDGLVALYRANPSTTISQVFPKLWNDSSDGPKTIAIRACTAIVTEAQRLPWRQPVSALRAEVAQAVRGVLRVQTGSIASDRSTPRRIRGHPELPSPQSDLAWEILNLFTLDPMFALVAGDGSELAQVLSAVSVLASPTSPVTVRATASKTNLVLLDHVVASGKKDPGLASLAASAASSIWQVLLDASRHQLQAFHLGDQEDFAIAVDAFRDTVAAVLEAVTTKPDVLSSNARSAVLLAMVAALTALTAPDVEQTSLSAPTLAALGKLVLVVNDVQANGQAPTPYVEEVLSQSALLEELSQLPAAKGRQQQQRQFRRVLKSRARSSTLFVAVWLGMVGRARTLTSKIVNLDADDTSAERDFRRRNQNADIEGLDEDESKEWQNLIAVLCCISSVCMYDASAPPSLLDVLGKNIGSLPRPYEEQVDPQLAVESFLRECVDFLISNSVHVRESMKDALGSELPPTLCRVLVVQMTKMLSISSGPNGVPASEALTTFVEQGISVLRLSVDRMHAGENTGAIQVDMGELLFLLGQYTHRLGRDDVAMRIKMRFCQLIEAVLDKPEFVVLGNAGRLRNALLEWMSEWSIEKFRDNEQTVQESKLHHDVDMACLRAMILVTEGLVLRPAGEETDDTQAVVKSRLFYRYYILLVKVLERANAFETESIKAPPSVSGSVRSHSIDSFPALAILVLSNLLSANIDVGLKHCLTLGYHEDPSIRTAFMQLLTNVLQQGTRFGGLNTKGVVATPKVYFDAMTDSNMALAVAMCESCPANEVDEISLLLFRVFEAKGTLLALIKVLVEREVAMTNHESELFRANSITTRLLTIFAKTYGYNYVRATLQPLIQSFAEKPSHCSFELDPSKAGPSDDIERNTDDLKLMCQALLDLICSSVPRVPIMFRALCHHIWEVVEDRFPDSRHSAVGSFIFLRFFCPAIVSPEGIDLDVNPDTREIRRALLLITKVIQNLANNVVFGNKEAHMKVLNSFLSENIRQVTKFLSDVAIRPRSWEVAQSTKLYQEETTRSLDADGDNLIIHRYINKHLPKIETSLENMPSSFRFRSQSSRTVRPELDGRSSLDNLRRLVTETGPPSDSARLSSSARSQIYDEFMRHNAGRSTESVAGAFYEGPASQNNRRIFYFIVARVALVDYDLLAYHVFSLLDKVTDFFDLVIDLTDFSASTELPIAWLRRSIQMCPPGILPCVNTLALYNPNSYAKRRLRRLISELSTISPSIGKNVVAASSPAELAEFIPFTSLALPEHTMALAYEADHVFTNLVCLSDHEMQVPVVVKLGHDNLQVASWRKQDLTSSQKAYIIDVIDLHDVDDMVYGTGLAADHLIIKHSQNESVTFISRKRNEMAQIIRAARGKLRAAPSEERALRPSDVPGTLLNVAFLNLSSDDEVLRLGAYGLINELCKFFKYDVSTRAMKVSSGLAIPSNSLTFIHGLSKALAVAAPQLTVEFLKEWTIGFAKASIPQKTACLHYVGPWLLNLETYAKPTQDGGIESVKQVGEIVRSLIALTVSERKRLHLALQQHVWGVMGSASEAVADVIIAEVLHSAIDAGLGSEKAECAADVLVSLASVTVRGKVTARLRKTIAQTYLKPSPTLPDNVAWNEICTLARISLALSFSPTSPIDLQLFLPDMVHIITLLLGSGPLLMRQTVYGLVVNIVQALATAAGTGDMDTSVLHHLLGRVQQADMVAAFGLTQSPGSLELSGVAPAQQSKDEAGVVLLDSVELVARFLGDVLTVGATSIDCANAWRARWMGLVAQTCFQHNPSIQPQALTVLGYLAADDVDDDLVFQVLVALCSSLEHFNEADTVVIISMLRSLARVISGLAPDSRYLSSLFWLAIAVLQLGYIPLFAPALDLLLTALRSMDGAGQFAEGLTEGLVASRSSIDDAARKLDQVCGVNFETDLCFSLVAVIFKGVRHPATRKLAIETIMELLMLSTRRPSAGDATAAAGKEEDGEEPLIGEKSVAFFVSLLPVVAASPQDLKALFLAAGVDVADYELRDVSTLSVFGLLDIPDNSFALMLVTLAVTILGSASSDSEKLVLYRFIAEASVDMPDVVARAYDSLIPRMTAVLATTASTAILSSVTLIFERAMADPSYAFPASGSGGIGSSGPGSTSTPAAAGGIAALIADSQSSLTHQKNYSASIISSAPSLGLGAGGAAGAGSGVGAREHLLEEMGMRGLMEMGFPSVKLDRLTSMAKWVAALIESLTG